MEHHRPKKLLDQVRAYPESAEGSKPTLAGSNATSLAQTGFEPGTCGS